MTGSLVKKFSTQSLGRLTSLRMSDSKVEDVDAEPLAALNDINVKGTPITRLDLRSCKNLSYAYGCSEEGREVMTGPDVKRD